MKDNREALTKINVSSTAKEMNAGDYGFLKNQNEKLQSENTELRKNLEREKLYHKNLYLQWTELQAGMAEKEKNFKQAALKRDPAPKLRLYTFYGLLFTTVLLLGFNYSTFKKQRDRQSGSAPLSGEIHSSLKEEDEGQLSNALPGNTITSVEKTSGVFIPPAAEPVKKNMQVQSPGKFAVKVKSYFHNKPDRDTRRSTFVLPWNDAYGILTATKEMNGFVYVVFTNRAGRTSKGWILKSDLEPVKP